jgi:hypothetical protein
MLYVENKRVTDGRTLMHEKNRKNHKSCLERRSSSSSRTLSQFITIHCHNPHEKKTTSVMTANNLIHEPLLDDNAMCEHHYERGPRTKLTNFLSASSGAEENSAH